MNATLQFVPNGTGQWNPFPEFSVCNPQKKSSKEMFNKKKKNNEQKCRVLVWIFLQTFRAWPFISGVYKVPGGRDRVCNNYGFIVIQLIRR